MGIYYYVFYLAVGYIYWVPVPLLQSRRTNMSTRASLTIIFTLQLIVATVLGLRTSTATVTIAWIVDRNPVLIYYGVILIIWGISLMNYTFKDNQELMLSRKMGDVLQLILVCIGTVLLTIIARLS